MSIFSSINAPLKVFTFSSENSISGSQSTFQSAPINLGQNEYDSVVVVDASFQKSFYNFPSGYNTFNLTENSTTVTITIPPGSYNKNNMITVLSNLLTSSSPNGWSYLLTYSAPTSGDTFKYTITVSGNGSSQPKITMLAGQLSPFRQLGFEDATTYTFSGNSLTSVNCLNFALVLVAYITTDMIVESQNGILQQFLNVGSFAPLSTIYFQQINYDMNAKSFNKGLKTSWTFNLVDDLFLPIDTNGVPWYFTVCFFKRATTHELHEATLSIQNDERLLSLQEQRNKIEDEIEAMNDDIFDIGTQINSTDQIQYPKV